MEFQGSWAGKPWDPKVLGCSRAPWFLSPAVAPKAPGRVKSWDPMVSGAPGLVVGLPGLSLRRSQRELWTSKAPGRANLGISRSGPGDDGDPITPTCNISNTYIKAYKHQQHTCNHLCKTYKKTVQYQRKIDTKLYNVYIKI